MSWYNFDMTEQERIDKGLRPRTLRGWWLRIRRYIPWV